MCVRFLVGILAVLVIASCSDKKEEPVVSVTPIALDEAEAFGQSIEAALIDGEVSYFNGLIELNRIAERAMKETGLSGAKKSQARSGMLEALNSMGFFQQVHRVVKNGGSYEMLRARSKGDQTTVIMRLLFPDGGVNYHELYLIGLGQGLRVDDIYVFLSGELITDTMERVVIQMLSQDKSFIEKLQGKKSEMAKHMNDITRMTELMRTGNFEKVTEIYQSLPESVKNEKSMLLVQLSAAQYVNDQLYLDAIQRFEKNYPQDPSLDLVSIDGFVMREEYDKALVCVDRLDASLGGDDYLNELRANVLLLNGDYEKAENIFLTQIENDPENQDAYWNMLSLKIESKSYYAALKWMRLLRDQYQADFSQIADTEYYADFAKSPAYQVWVSENQQ